MKDPTGSEVSVGDTILHRSSYPGYRRGVVIEVCDSRELLVRWVWNQNPYGIRFSKICTGFLKLAE